MHIKDIHIKAWRPAHQRSFTLIYIHVGLCRSQQKTFHVYSHSEYWAYWWINFSLYKENTVWKHFKGAGMYNWASWCTNNLFITTENIHFSWLAAVLLSYSAVVLTRRWPWALSALPIRKTCKYTKTNEELILMSLKT